MNFDGTTDIRLLNWISPSSETRYWYWFYNETTGQFLYNTALVELRDPVFDSLSKTIHFSWRDGFYSYGHAMYEWHDNKIQLIADEVENWSDDPNAPVIRTIRRRINGKIDVQEIEVNANVPEIDYIHNPNECKLRKK